MTTATANIPMDGSTSSASWVSIGKGISDLLTAAGVTKTADTGQIDWGAVSRPAVQATVVGYEIRDIPTSSGTLRMKITYGSGTSYTSNYGFGITFGTGSNGSGTLTGTLGAEQWISPSVLAWNSATVYPSYASSWDGGFALVLNPMATSTDYKVVLIFDTTCDNSGAKTSQGYLWVINNPGGGSRVEAYGYSSSLSTRAAFATFPARLPYHYQASQPSCVVDKKRRYSVVRHLTPSPAWHKNILIGNAQDTPCGMTFSATVLGANQTYLSVGPTHGGFNGNILSATSDLTASLCFRWE